MGLSDAVARAETKTRVHQGAHLGSSQVARHKDEGSRKVDLAIVTQRQRSFVQDAEQEVPKSIAGLLDFVEEYKAQFAGLGVILAQHFLAQQWMRLAMTQVSWGRSDQLRNFMAMLEFRAIDLNN